LLDVLLVRGRLKLQNQERSLPRVLDSNPTIGIDIGKNMFYLVGFDGNGAIVLRQKLSRRQVEARLAANVGFKSVDA